MIKIKLWWALLAISLAVPTCLNAEQVTVDALMRLRSISDVKISPDGKQIAYVVSAPSLETAGHEAVLYRIPVGGGTPLRLTYRTRIFNKPLPSPWLRWSPDGSLLSFIAYVDDTPQVVAMSSAGGETWPLTAIKGGVARYEWSPNGKEIVFIATDPATPEEERQKKEKSYVIGVVPAPRPPRLSIQAIPGGVPRAVTPTQPT